MAGVIRQEEGSSAAIFSFQDLEEQARAVLRRAEQQAQQIVAQADIRAQQVVEQRGQEARQRGLEEGRNAGLAQIQAEARQTVFAEQRERLSELASALTAGLSEFDQKKCRLIALAEAEMIELALAIARRVCKLHVADSSEAARANARHLLELVCHDEDIELHVHPAEHEALRDVATEFLENVERMGHVEVVADPAIARGGCRLVSRAGAIDASLESQLQRVAAAICSPAGPTGEAGGVA
ncbi:MAG: hypothetical protein KKB50_13755 [Planctomycetes bacterium]|nr:hypothetical protein [Planctomycetota bacterium]